jgi:hypothetical protein
MKHVLIFSLFFLLCSCSTKTSYPVNSGTQFSQYDNIKPSASIKPQPPKIDCSKQNNSYSNKNNYSNSESDKHNESVERINGLGKDIDTNNDCLKYIINKADKIIESPTKK